MKMPDVIEHRAAKEAANQAAKEAKRAELIALALASVPVEEPAVIEPAIVEPAAVGGE
jgi:hypothetical protein